MFALTSAQYKKIMVVLLVFATTIFEFTINIFLPILPALQDHYLTTPHMVQYSISAYLFGFSLLGLVAGPLSDYVGRRKIMLAGLLLFWLGSALCYWYATRSLFIFIASRFVQGLGAGIATVLIIAIIRDLFALIRAAQVLSLMGVVIAVAPMIAPVLGGVFAEFSDWTYIFLLILVLSKFIVCAFFILGRESIQERKSFNMRRLFHESRSLLKHRECMGYVVISALVYGVLFAWITQAPFFFEEMYDLDDLDYALYSSLGPLVYIIGSFVNYVLLKHFDILVLLRRGMWVCGGACMLLLSLAFLQNLPMWWYLGTFLIFNAGLAFVFSNTAAKAVDLGGDKRGATSAYLASMEQLCAAIATSVVGLWGDLTLVPTTVFMVIGCSLSMIVFVRTFKLSQGEESQSMRFLI